MTTSRRAGPARTTLLVIGAIAFLFPFYYMVIGALQAHPDEGIGGLVPTQGLTLSNFTESTNA